MQRYKTCQATAESTNSQWVERSKNRVTRARPNTRKLGNKHSVQKSGSKLRKQGKLGSAIVSWDYSIIVCQVSSHVRVLL